MGKSSSATNACGSILILEGAILHTLQTKKTNSPCTLAPLHTHNSMTSEICAYQNTQKSNTNRTLKRVFIKLQELVLGKTTFTKVHKASPPPVS